MRLRFPAACPRRRSPGAPSSQARRRHVAVESLEVRELLTVDFTSVMGFGAPTLTAGAVAVDAAGDTFIAGTFGGNLNLNPGPGVTTLTSAGNRDIYLAEILQGRRPGLGQGPAQLRGGRRPGQRTRPGRRREPRRHRDVRRLAEPQPRRARRHLDGGGGPDRRLRGEVHPHRRLPLGRQVRGHRHRPGQRRGDRRGRRHPRHRQLHRRDDLRRHHPGGHPVRRLPREGRPVGQRPLGRRLRRGGPRLRGARRDRRGG